MSLPPHVLHESRTHGSQEADRESRTDAEERSEDIMKGTVGTIGTRGNYYGAIVLIMTLSVESQ